MTYVILFKNALSKRRAALWRKKYPVRKHGKQAKQRLKPYIVIRFYKFFTKIVASVMCVS